MSVITYVHTLQILKKIVKFAKSLSKTRMTTIVQNLLTDWNTYLEQRWINCLRNIYIFRRNRNLSSK